MARFLEKKCINPKLKQSEIAKELGYSSSTIKRHKNDIKMLSLHRISSYTNHTRKRNISKTNHDDAKMTSNDLRRPQMVSIDPEVKPIESKNKLEGDTIIEVNDKYLDEILHNHNLKMELAMQMISIDQTVRSATVKDLKDFISHSLATQAKKGEQLVSMIPAIKKTLDVMGDDINELSTKNDASKKIGAYDGKS